MRLLLLSTLLLCACRSAPVGPSISAIPPHNDAFAVIGMVDSIGAGLWPGFDPRAIPVAIYDGSRTLLFRHPSPPAEFTRSASVAQVFEVAGRHPAVTSNSWAEIGGVLTATAIPPRVPLSVREHAAVIVHEAFHVHQRVHHPGWMANEAALFTYPARDADLVSLRRMETEALRRALTSDRERSRCWARNAMARRADRYAMLPADLAEYERKTELAEGLAAYLQRLAAREPDSTAITRTDFAPHDVRLRAYSTGPALALLLDRFAPNWKTDVTRSDSVALDALLTRALNAQPMATDCAFTGEEVERNREAAAAAVRDFGTELTRLREEFIARPGWRVTVISTHALLFPQGFDPLNVRVLGDGEVLHSRFLKLGGSAGTVEVFNGSALTVSAGPHPLFNGVREVVVAGLTAEPEVSGDDSGHVVLTAPGLKVELRGAGVERTAQSVTVRLRQR